MERTKKKEPEIIRKKKPAVKIYDFVTELQTWIKFTELELRQAKASRIDTSTGPYFKSLVRDFKKGLYDEDLDIIGDSVKQMLKNTASYSKL